MPFGIPTPRGGVTIEENTLIGTLVFSLTGKIQHEMDMTGEMLFLKSHSLTFLFSAQIRSGKTTCGE